MCQLRIRHLVVPVYVGVHEPTPHQPRPHLPATAVTEGAWHVFIGETWEIARDATADPASEQR